MIRGLLPTVVVGIYCCVVNAILIDKITDYNHRIVLIAKCINDLENDI